MTTEATIYIGTPEALQAEIGLLPCYTGNYVVAAFNAAGAQITPESDIATQYEAYEMAGEIKAWLESCGETVRVSFIA